MRHPSKGGPELFRGTSVAAAICLILGWGVVACPAQQLQNSPYPNQQTNQQQNQQQKPPPAKPPPPTPEQIAAKQKKIAQDQAAVTTAQKDWYSALQQQRDLENQYRAAFNKTKPWVAASKALSDARSALDAAKQSVMDNLAKDNDYQQALADKKQAQSDLDAAKASGQATPQTLTPLAQRVLDNATKVTKMEQEAMADDQTVLAARTKLSAAQADVDQLNAQFQSALSVTKDYVASRDATDAARKNVQTAQAKLASESGR